MPLSPLLTFLDLSFLICKVKVHFSLEGALIETLHTEVPWEKQPSATPKEEQTVSEVIAYPPLQKDFV